MKEANKTFISSTFWTERIGYVAALKTLEEMKKIKSWEILKTNGLKIKNLWKTLAKKSDLKCKITGLDALPCLNFENNENLKFKSFLTQQMLKQKILASNVVFTSIFHSGKYLNEYKKAIIPIFNKL